MRCSVSGINAGVFPIRRYNEAVAFYKNEEEQEAEHFLNKKHEGMDANSSPDTLATSCSGLIQGTRIVVAQATWKSTSRRCRT